MRILMQPTSRAGCRGRGNGAVGCREREGHPARVLVSRRS
jgi:hypothetical protein